MSIILSVSLDGKGHEIIPEGDREKIEGTTVWAISYVAMVLKNVTELTIVKLRLLEIL